MSTSYGPYDPTKAGSALIQYSGPKAYLVVFNQSDYQLSLTIKLQQSQGTPILPARSQRPFVITGQSLTVSWSNPLLTTKTPVGPQILYIEIFDQTELNQNELAFISPSSLSGNSALNFSSVSNDGNPANTVFVESTVQGDTSSCVTLTNDGKLTIGNAAHPGQISLDAGKITSDGAGNLSAASIRTTGNVADGGTLTVTGKISTDGAKFTSDGAGNLSAASITTTGAVDGASGSISGNMAANTFSLIAGGAPSYTMLQGSLSRINTFTGSASGTFNHGLGATPSNFNFTYSGNFGTPPSQCIAWYNPTSSQVSVHAQSGYAWQADCWHF